MQIRERINQAFGRDVSDDAIILSHGQRVMSAGQLWQQIFQRRRCSDLRLAG